MQNPKVWVIQEGKNDYAPAEEFGTVNFVTHSDLIKFENSSQNQSVDMDIRKFLSNYLPGTDFIIPTGNPMVVAKLIQSLPKGEHLYLKWDGRRGLYVPFKIGSVN